MSKKKFTTTVPYTICKKCKTALAGCDCPVPKGYKPVYRFNDKETKE